MSLSTILTGHVLDVLPTLATGSVQTICTSPPYLGLRDYGLPPTIWGGHPACEHSWEEGDGFCIWACGAWRGSLGLEPSVDLYITHMLMVFAELWRVLRDDGTVWLNIGDSYCSIGHKKSGSGYGTTGLAGGHPQVHTPLKRENNTPGLKHKDLMGVPWRLAFALQDSGWYLRSDIIWAKPNAMPESVEDRPTRSHEFVFLLAKSERYFYDGEAIKEPIAEIRLRGPNEYRGQAEIRPRGNLQRALSQPAGRRKVAQAVPTGWDTRIGEGGHTKLMGRYPHPSETATMNAEDAPPQDPGPSEVLASDHEGDGMTAEETPLVVQGKGNARTFRGGGAYTQGRAFDNSTPVERESHGNVPNETGTRNKRDVWWIATRPFPAAHFAVMPEQLVEPCILAGSSAWGACPQCGAPWRRLVERTRTVDGEPAPELGTWREDTIAAPNTAQGIAHARIATVSRTLGWEQTCQCPTQDPVPCVVLDPFCGSGTVPRVAARLGRAGVGIDLKPDYVDMATARTTGVQIALPL